MSPIDWARAHGPALFSAAIRSEPSEFDVTEELGFEFSGDGEHDYLFIEKTNANTEWVSRQLARFAKVPQRDVGYAGLKDRRAVTRQWFSVPRWHSPDWHRLQADGIRLLEVERHDRKLRRGAHRGNRFRIVLRGALPKASQLDERLTSIAQAGVPNYFGEQRFGRQGSNIALANAWADGRRLGRHKRSLAISTARSYLFNRVLDKRVRERSWNRLVAGDTVNLDGTGSVFEINAVDNELERRCRQMDIHPAGALCGQGTPLSSIPAEHENWLHALTRARVKPASRPFRLVVANLQWSIAGGSLELRFKLGRGAYATAVLRELADITNEAREKH